MPVVRQPTQESYQAQYFNKHARREDDAAGVQPAPEQGPHTWGGRMGKCVRPAAARAILIDAQPDSPVDPPDSSYMETAYRVFRATVAWDASVVRTSQ